MGSGAVTPPRGVRSCELFAQVCTHAASPSTLGPPQASPGYALFPFLISSRGMIQRKQTPPWGAEGPRPCDQPGVTGKA